MLLCKAILEKENNVYVLIEVRDEAYALVANDRVVCIYPKQDWKLETLLNELMKAGYVLVVKKDMEIEIDKSLY